MANEPVPTSSRPVFIARHAPELLRRFTLSYRHAFSCVDYYVDDIQSGQRISKEILFSLDRRNNRIVVARFYPEIFKQTNSKYLSATCFFLMIHHFSQALALPVQSTIYLCAKPLVFSSFYAKLNNFAFHVDGSKTDTYLDVVSAFDRLSVDTSMIVERPGIETG